MKQDDIIGPQPKAVWTILATLSLLAIGVATFWHIFEARQTPYFLPNRWFAYLYSAGALLLIISRIMTQYKGCVERVKRLSRIELWSAIFFCVAAFFIFYEPRIPRDWLAFTLAGAAIQIYTSIAIPLALRKALKSNKNED